VLVLNEMVLVIVIESRSASNRGQLRIEVSFESRSASNRFQLSNTSTVERLSTSTKTHTKPLKLGSDCVVRFNDDGSNDFTRIVQLPEFPMPIPKLDRNSFFKLFDELRLS
jgi:hypothetical protein